VKEGRLAGSRPLGAEEDLARALARSLHESGKPVVYTDRVPRDILTAADRKLRQLDPVGVPVNEFTAAQREGLMKLITEYADRHRPELEKDRLAEITRDFANRIQGADFLVEVANVQNEANHIHTVWRDRAGDFGRDVLGEHELEH
jgi:NAD(P)-dependent dehydrogenase (short-subunit alcohol dehydrogenase family)